MKTQILNNITIGSIVQVKDPESHYDGYFGIVKALTASTPGHIVIEIAPGKILSFSLLNLIAILASKDQNE